MYCQNCGNKAPDNAQNCPSCGTRLGRGGALASELSGRAKAASLDALQSLKIFATNPVGGLKPAYEGLGSDRALAVGFVFAIAFAVLLAVGMTIGLQRYHGWLSFLVSSSNSGFIQFLKSFFVGLVPSAALFASCALARVMFRGRGDSSGDLFTAGAALLPAGCLVLVSSLLGVGNVEVVVILSVFALSYTILILYSGCTGISNTTQAGAALAVPVMLIVTAWLSKVILTAVW